MIQQHIYLDSADWHLTILYDVRPNNADEVIHKLQHIGCSPLYLKKATDVLLSGAPNEGLTYTNEGTHCSLIVVGHVTDLSEALSTLSHEKQHLEQSICRAYNLDPYGETIAYISGDISAAIAQNAWHVMKRFVYALI